MASPSVRPWKTLSRRTIHKYNKFLTIESHEVQLPDGELISDWPWIIGPDAVIVLAVTSEQKFLCFRQTKYAVEGTSLAPVGGGIEPDEIPLDAARRELLEETGYESSDWVNLGNYKVDANRGVGVRYLFLALNAKQIAEPDSDDLEDQQLLFLSQSELETALVTGEFKVLSWATVVALVLHHLYHNPK